MLQLPSAASVPAGCRFVEGRAEEKSLR
jgi:hypothetical protein